MYIVCNPRLVHTYVFVYTCLNKNLHITYIVCTCTCTCTTHVHAHMYMHLQVITMAPHHDIWQRSRRAYHGGAIRAYAKPPSPQYGRTSPVHCEHCARAQDGEEQGERERERKVEGEGWGAWEEDPETEDPLPKFDLLDEIDFSTGMARGRREHTLPPPLHTPALCPT